MRSKTLALLLVAVIASGIVFAVSAQSQITAADIAKAILPGGFINPKSIVPGAITSEHIADDTITKYDIGPNAVEASELADDAVDTGAIQNDAVTSAKIKDYTITASNIGPNAINSTMIINGEVQELDIAAGVVNESHLKADAIPATRANTTTAVITSNASYPSLAYDSWNVTITTHRDAYLIIHWTGFDCWTTDIGDAEAGNATYMRIAVDGTPLTAPFTNIILCDHSTSNKTTSVTAYYWKPVTSGSHTITFQIRGAYNGYLYGVNAQSAVIEALPA